MGPVYCLLASLCWAITPLISTHSLRQVGTVAFSGSRFVVAATCLGVFVALTGRFDGLVYSPTVGVLLLSGIVGISIGDILLFKSLKTLGPRRSYFLLSLNVPLTIFAANLLFDESLSGGQWLGCILVVCGVLLVVSRNQPNKNMDALDATTGRVLTGVLAGLGSAACQATSILLIKEGVVHGVDPILATWLRLAAAAVVISLPLFLRAIPKSLPLFRAKDVRNIFLAALVGNMIGMTFLTLGVENAPAGVVSFLTSLAPILLIPLVAIADGTWPTRQSVVGAILATLGVFFVFH